MTLTQLEKYMIAEIENLHLKIDTAVEALSKQMYELMEYISVRFDRIEKQLEQHTTRLTKLEGDNST